MYNQEYLESLIRNKVEENINLDYKSSKSLEFKNEKKYTEISKDVSAFANSDGGIIIYGIKEDNENRHLPIEIEPINRKEFEKECLEQIINSRIKPRIENIIIYPIEINNDINKVVYIIEIPKSTTAHQAFDKRYYRRYNFLSEAMYDYEIRDILNRAKNPKIDIEFEIEKYTYEEKGIFGMPLKIEYKTVYNLLIYARNNGKVFAKYVNCFFTISKFCLIENYYNSFNDDKYKININNTVRDLINIEHIGIYPIEKYGPSRYEPILPSLSQKLKEFKITEYAINNDNDTEIEWEVYVDNSEPKVGKIKFSEIKIKDITRADSEMLSDTPDAENK